MSSRATTLLMHVKSVRFSVPQYLRHEINRLKENNRMLELLKYNRHKRFFFSSRKRGSFNSNNLTAVQLLQLPLTNKEYLHTCKLINSGGKKLRLVVISNETSVIFVGVCKHKVGNLQCSFPN